MESLVYVGVDVHKDTYFLCCYAPSGGEFFAEARIDADARLVKKCLEEAGYLGSSTIESRPTQLPSLA